MPIGRGEDERGEHVRGSRGGGELMRRVLEHGPPEEQTGREVARVLHVKHGRLMAEGRVVGDGEVPGGVRREPQRQCDNRMREHTDGPSADRCGRRALRARRARRVPAPTPRTRRSGVDGRSAETSSRASRGAWRRPPARGAIRRRSTRAASAGRPLNAHADRVRTRQPAEDEQLVRESPTGSRPRWLSWQRTQAGVA